MIICKRNQETSKNSVASQTCFNKTAHNFPPYYSKRLWCLCAQGRLHFAQRLGALQTAHIENRQDGRGRGISITLSESPRLSCLFSICAVSELPHPLEATRIFLRFHILWFDFCFYHNIYNRIFLENILVFLFDIGRV